MRCLAAIVPAAESQRTCILGDSQAPAASCLSVVQYRFGPFGTVEDASTSLTRTWQRVQIREGGSAMASYFGSNIGCVP